MTNYRMLAILAAIGLSATTAKATTLDFGNATCVGVASCANGNQIDPGWGSTTQVAVSYTDDITNTGTANPLAWWKTQETILPVLHICRL